MKITVSVQLMIFKIFNQAFLQTNEICFKNKSFEKYFENMQVKAREGSL